jgi:hypothetical protein
VEFAWLEYYSKHGQSMAKAWSKHDQSDYSILVVEYTAILMKPFGTPWWSNLSSFSHYR